MISHRTCCIGGVYGFQLPIRPRVANTEIGGDHYNQEFPVLDLICLQV